MNVEAISYTGEHYIRTLVQAHAVVRPFERPAGSGLVSIELTAAPASMKTVRELASTAPTQDLLQGQKPSKIALTATEGETITIIDHKGNEQQAGEYEISQKDLQAIFLMPASRG